MRYYCNRNLEQLIAHTYTLLVMVLVLENQPDVGFEHLVKTISKYFDSVLHTTSIHCLKPWNAYMSAKMLF